MTVEKKVRVTPTGRRDVCFEAESGKYGFGAFVNKWGHAMVTYKNESGPRFVLYADEIDALIELLHAVKSDAAEQAGVDVHTLEATA